MESRLASAEKPASNEFLARARMHGEKQTQRGGLYNTRPTGGKKAGESSAKLVKCGDECGSTSGAG